jgi:hypothetical protein
VRAKVGHELGDRCGYLVAKRAQAARRRAAGQAMAGEQAELAQIALDTCKPG